MDENDILSMTMAELGAFLVTLGEKSFRASQIFSWLHKSGCKNYDEMTNVSIGLRRTLSEKAPLRSLNITKKTLSGGDAVKYGYETHDGHFLEGVLLKHDYGNTVCVSSQIGCAMGCSFCASTLGGLTRNLSAGEMCAQIYEIYKDSGEPVNNIVVMGGGEPLHNYDNLLKFIGIINSSDGRNIGARHITVSTCGLVPQIRQMAELKLQINLAVSLHSPFDNKRQSIMPIAQTYSVAELIAAADGYAKTTGRRVTYEYTLMDGVNDDDRDAKELAKLLRGKLAHVNVLPLNKHSGTELQKSRNTARFIKLLKNGGVNVTARRSGGDEINAACGQLRASVLKFQNALKADLI
ncbi:putative dual-specificity RNA methyltransferase RlmN [Clostridia bacterium]|nr:putative dual-specificity RNA methyltransferase RlmN [Clostridia bacterium]